MSGLSSELRVDLPSAGEYSIGKYSCIGEFPNDASDRRMLVDIACASFHPVRIGANTKIREQCLIDLGINRSTEIGNDVYIHSRCTIGHDCVVQNNVVLAPCVNLSGSCTVMSDAQIGASSVLHQGTVIGRFAMVGMGSVVTRDIPPFVLAYGSPCRVVGLNTRKLGMVLPPEMMDGSLQEYMLSIRSHTVEAFAFGNTFLDAILKDFLEASSRKVAF